MILRQFRIRKTCIQRYPETDTFLLGALRENIKNP